MANLVVQGYLSSPLIVTQGFSSSAVTAVSPPTKVWTLVSRETTWNPPVRGTDWVAPARGTTWTLVER